MLEGYLLFVDLSWNFVYRLRHEKCEGRPVRDDGIAADEPMAVHPAVFAAGRTAGRTAARKQFRPVCSGHLFLLKFFDGQSTLYGH
jgi:hypothetical protein